MASNTDCVRRDVCIRWQQLLDDASHLETAIEAAPDGTFDADDRFHIAHVIDTLLMRRPTMPQTPRRKQRRVRQ